MVYLYFERPAWLCLIFQFWWMPAGLTTHQVLKGKNHCTIIPIKACQSWSLWKWLLLLVELVIDFILPRMQKEKWDSMASMVRAGNCGRENERFPKKHKKRVADLKCQSLYTDDTEWAFLAQLQNYTAMLLCLPHVAYSTEKKYIDWVNTLKSI